MEPRIRRPGRRQQKRISGCLYGRMGSLGQDPGAVFAGSNRNPLNEEKRVDVNNRDETRMWREQI
jgi:hypothetical protein